MLKRLQTESELDYIIRVCAMKDETGYTWNEIADILNTELNYSFSPDKYRKDYYKSLQNTNNDLDFTLDELKLMKYKLADERTQINNLYRRISREQTLVEMAKTAAEVLNEKIVLLPLAPTHSKLSQSKKEAILEISDWHYGLDVCNHWNTYNPDVAKKRISQLFSEVVDKCDREDIEILHIVNLGDLISGRIHLPLRINSRLDVITQVIQVSELLAEFLHSLATKYQIHYYDTLDNHSRIEPSIKDSIDLESLARITTWFLKERVPEIKYHSNTFSDDIISFDVLNYKVIGVHGHKDKPIDVIEKLSMMTKQHYDLVLTAHLHHFSADERNETLVVSNGSLMGTDDYAEKLRLTSKPSQNLIIVSEKSPIETLYRIILD